VEAGSEKVSRHENRLQNRWQMEKTDRRCIFDGGGDKASHVLHPAYFKLERCRQSVDMTTLNAYGDVAQQRLGRSSTVSM